MKKLFLIIMLSLPFALMAKEKQDDTKYLRGAVPEVNGIVTFHKTINANGKNKQQTYNLLKGYLSNLVENSIPAPGPYARLHQDSPDTLAANVVEWQEYKRKFLNLDRSRFRYTLNCIIVDGNVSVDITRISYYYREDQEGNNGEQYKAEEWISDKEAINKKGNKLLPGSAKFRRFTVDRAEQIFAEIENLFK